MRYPQRVGLIILLAGVAAGIAIYTMTRAGRSAPTFSIAAPEVIGQVNAASNAVHTQDSPLETGRIAVETVGQSTQPAPAAEIPGELKQNPDDLYRQLVDRLEESVAGALGTGDLLEAALEVARLELDERPATEVDPAGRIAYPYVGTPDGLSASLMIQRSVRTGMLGLTLKMDVARPTTPYWVDGYARGEPKMELLVRIDSDGRPTSFGILTETQVSGVNAKYGIDCMAGQIPTGMSYEVDLNAPFEWKVNTIGVLNGGPTSWKPSVFLGGSPADDIKKINELTALMQGAYQGLKQ